MQNEVESVNNKENQNTDIIQKCIGVFGKWHFWICTAIFLVKFPVAFHQLNIVFLAPPHNFSCVDSSDKCAYNCSEHVFDKSLFTETIVTEWDLVCNRSYLISFAQTVTMVGILFGNMIFGYFSDRYGRRTPFILAVILQLIVASATAFSPWLSLFFILRFFSGFATGGTMVTSFVLIMELVGMKWRTALGILYQIPFNLGHLLLPMIAYYIRKWRIYQLAISLPSIIFISYYWILPESPRWLLSVGESERATAVMEKIANYNSLPSATIKNDVEVYCKEKMISKDVNNAKSIDLLRTPVMRMYTLLMWLCWFVCGFCFYGVAQFAGQLAGNIFINVALSAAMQVPGNLFCIWAVKNWGRKITLCSSSLIGGLSCLLIAVVPSDPTWIKAMLSCIGQVAFMIAFSTSYIYAAELFPTPVRNVGVGTSSMSARIGSIVAPFVVGLVTVKQWLPPLIFGLIPVISAILCLKLPETLNSRLPDTVEEAEQFVTKNKNRFV